MKTRTPKMNGQWIGRYDGSATGQVIVNVDERAVGFEGVASLINDNPASVNAFAFFKTKGKAHKFRFRADILPVNPRSGYIDSWEVVRRFYPDGTTMSQHAEVTGSWTRDTLKLSWTTDLGLTGECSLPRSRADKPSELVAVDKAWSAFKEYAADLEGGQYLFRGQNQPWRLRTSFHRAGRADVMRFLREDVQALYRNLSARTKHVFNLDIPNENGAFFNLFQHHGYPSPLLDWTYSPYVAAFFAYRGISNMMAEKAAPTKKVRILVFDQSQWRSDLPQLLLLAPATLHFSIGEFLAIENERMIPQQAASTVTNADDIEAYIKSKETEGKKYLAAIDLPMRERKKVIQELSFMGITAGSLFPGLDGACEELRERNFPN